MGKRLIQQRRGKGSSMFQSPSHRYYGKLSLLKVTPEPVRGEIVDLVNSVGHSAPLMIVKYEDGQVSLLPAVLGIKKGQEVHAGSKVPAEIGNVVPLSDVPTGTEICNIESTPFDGGRFIRSSGTLAHVAGKEGNKVVIKLPSKKDVKINGNCRVLIGSVAGAGRKTKPYYKAGKRYHARKARSKVYPKVRGVAMNAIDHPHGGTHSRNSPGGSTTRSRNLPPGAKVGQIAAKRTGRKKK